MSAATYQVIFIECDTTRLYGELVQQVPDRQTCWLRPLSLRLAAADSAEFYFLDVRNGPDIICADHLIQPVLDTDWLQVLATMSDAKLECDYPKANQYLRQFLQQVLSQAT